MEVIHQEQGDDATARASDSAAATADAVPPTAAGAIHFRSVRPSSSLLLSGAISTAAVSPTSNNSTGSNRQHASSSQTAADALKEATTLATATTSSLLEAVPGAATSSMVEAASATATRSRRAAGDVHEANEHLNAVAAAAPAATSRHISAAKHIDSHIHMNYSAAEGTKHMRTAAASPPCRAFFGTSGDTHSLPLDEDSNPSSTVTAPAIARAAAGGERITKLETAARGETATPRETAAGDEIAARAETAAEREPAADGKTKCETAEVHLSVGAAHISERSTVPLFRRKLIRSTTLEFPASTSLSSSSETAAATDADAAALLAHRNGRVSGAQRLRDMLLKKPASFLASSLRRSRNSVAAQQDNADPPHTSFAADTPRENDSTPIQQEQQREHPSHEQQQQQQQQQQLQEPLSDGIQEQMAQQEKREEDDIDMQQGQRSVDEREMQYTLSQEQDLSPGVHASSEAILSKQMEQSWVYYPEKSVESPRRESFPPADAATCMPFSCDSEGQQPRYRGRITPQQHVAASMMSGVRCNTASVSTGPHIFSSQQQQQEGERQHSQRQQEHEERGHSQQQHQHHPGHVQQEHEQRQQYHNTIHEHPQQQQQQRQRHSSEFSQQQQQRQQQQQQQQPHQHAHHHQQHHPYERLPQQQQHICVGGGGTGGGNAGNQQQGKQNFRLRVLWAVILALPFIVILAAGHVYTAALVLALIALMYREIIAVKRRRDEGRLPPDFTLLKWYWFTITIIGMGVPAVLRLPWIFPTFFPTFPWTATTSSSNNTPHSGITYTTVPSYSGTVYSNIPHSSILQRSTSFSVPVYRRTRYSSRSGSAVVYDGNVLPSQANSQSLYESGSSRLRKSASSPQEEQQDTSTFFQQQQMTRGERRRKSCNHSSIEGRHQDCTGCLCDNNNSSSSTATGDLDLSAAAMLPSDMHALTSSMSSAIQASLRSSAGFSSSSSSLDNDGRIVEGGSLPSVSLKSPLSAAVSDDNISSLSHCLQDASACERPSSKSEAFNVKGAAGSSSSSYDRRPGEIPVPAVPLRTTSSSAVSGSRPSISTPSRPTGSPSPLGASPSPLGASPSPLIPSPSPLVASSAWGVGPGGGGVLSPGPAAGNHPVGIQLWGHAAPDRVLAVHSLLVYAAAFVGLVWFILSLRKGMLRSQFSQLGVMLVALVFIVAQALVQIANIYSGLIWFLLPTLLVIVNDVSAYICGKLFGRTRLIRLSPKKTVEGFVGASLVTLVCANFASQQLQQYSAFTCPPTAVDLRPFAVWKDLHCPESEVFRPRCFDADLAALLPSFLSSSVALDGKENTSVHTPQQQLSPSDDIEVGVQAAASITANPERGNKEEDIVRGGQDRQYGGRGILKAEEELKMRAEDIPENFISSSPTTEHEREAERAGDSLQEGNMIGKRDNVRRRCTKKTWREGDINREKCDMDMVGIVDGREEDTYDEENTRDRNGDNVSLGKDTHRNVGDKKEQGNVSTSMPDSETEIRAVAAGREEAGNKRWLSNRRGGDAQQQVGYINGMSQTEGRSTLDETEYILQQQQTVTDTFDTMPKTYSEATLRITSSSVSSPPVHLGVKGKNIKAVLSSAFSTEMKFDKAGEKADSSSSPGAGDVTRKETATNSSAEVKKCHFYISPFQLHALVLGMFAAFFAPFGGFLASGFKRAARVKDFGEVIPGHGGITDRFDCQVLMGTFTHLYYKSFVYSAPDLVPSVSPLATQVGAGGAGFLPSNQLLLTPAHQHPGTAAAGASFISPSTKQQQHVTATLELLQQQHPPCRPSRHRRCKRKGTKKTGQRRPSSDKRRHAGIREDEEIPVASQAHSGRKGEARKEDEELRQRSVDAAEGHLPDDRNMLQQQTMQEQVYQSYVSKSDAAVLASQTLHGYTEKVIIQSEIDEQQQHSEKEREATQSGEALREVRKTKETGEKDEEDPLTEEEDEEEEEEEEEENMEENLYFRDILEVVASIDDVRELELVNQVVLEKMVLLQEQQQHRLFVQPKHSEEQPQQQQRMPVQQVPQWQV